MIYIASDHGGFELKEEIKRFLATTGYAFEDFGTNSTDSVDYPDYAYKVAKEVAKSKDNKGILICNTGAGMCIVANKVKGIRAAECYNEETARLSRDHNDANVLCLGGKMTSKELAEKMVKIWLETPFSNGERHLRRLGKIPEIEKREMK